MSEKPIAWRIMAAWMRLQGHSEDEISSSSPESIENEIENLEVVVRWKTAAEASVSYANADPSTFILTPSEQTKPQPGEWWIHGENGGRLFVVHRGNDSRLWCENRHSEVFSVMIDADAWRDWRHEPRCTGWDWVTPPPAYELSDLSTECKDQLREIVPVPEMRWMLCDANEESFQRALAEMGYGESPPQNQEVAMCPECCGVDGPGHENVCPGAWVEITDPDHVLRGKGIDFCRRKDSGASAEWKEVTGLAGCRVALQSGWYEFRCRRKDLPVPMIAQSVAAVCEEWTRMAARKPVRLFRDSHGFVYVCENSEPDADREVIIDGTTVYLQENQQ